MSGRRTTRRAILAAAGAVLATLGLGAEHASATAIATRTVRAAPFGVDPNASSAQPAVSPDGRYVAFVSTASNLGPSTAIGTSHVYESDMTTGHTWLVSSPINGRPEDGASEGPSLGAGGYVVAFASRASNLVAGGTGHHMNVFVRLGQGPVVQISRRVGGGQPDGDSSEPVVSADGRFVAFSSQADDLIAGDDNSASDAFVYDVAAGTLTRVSVSSRGSQLDGPSSAPAMSADGRYVSFTSAADDAVSGDHNHLPDVFVYDRSAGSTRRVSVNSHGRGQNASISPPFTQTSAISADGRYVTFDSDATNLVRGDDNGHTDVFRHDTVTGATVLVSRDSLGGQGDNDSFSPAMSADGNEIVFDSYASHLAGPWAPIVNVYVRYVPSGTTSILDVAANGGPRGSELSPQLLQRPVISADGAVAAFVSGADDLVASDFNGANDVFIRDLAPPVTRVVTPPPASGSNRRPVVEFAGDDRLAYLGLMILDGKRISTFAGRPVRLPKLGLGPHMLTMFAGGPGMLYDPVGATVKFTVTR